MKRALLSLLLVLCFQSFTLSQTANSSACPILSVTGPSGATKPGSFMEFTANVKDFDISKLKLEWTVINGESINGQGTLLLTVKPIDCQKETTATAKVLGLPESCPNSVTAEGLNSDCNSKSIAINEYATTTVEGEKRILNEYTVKLKDEPTATAFITKSFPRTFSKAKAYLKLQQILNYLETRGISKERIIFGTNYDINEKTTLWLVYAGAQIPIFEGEILDVVKLTEKINTFKPKTKR